MIHRVQDVRTGVYEIVAAVFAVRTEDIDPNTSWEELGVDSFDLVEFIVALAEHFELDLEPAELNDVRSIDDIVRFVYERRLARPLGEQA